MKIFNFLQGKKWKYLGPASLLFCRKLSAGFTITMFDRILKKKDNQASYRGIKKIKKLMYSYDIVENMLPRWVSRGYVVSVGMVKLSGQVQDRKEKVNPVEKIKSGVRNITTKNRKTSVSI